MAWTERYVDAAAAGGGDGTTTATSGANGAWTLAEAIAAYAAGQRINVKAGTYANTTTSRTFGTSGTTTAPVWWRGYNTTAGDIDTNNSLTKPAITFTTGQMVLSGSYQLFSNLDISGAQTTNGQVRINTGTKIWVHRCRIACTSANANGRAISMASGDNAVTNCYLTATTTATNIVDNAQNGTTFIANTFAGGSVGVLVGGTPPQLYAFNVFRGQSSDAIRTSSTSRVWLIGNTVYGAGADGFNIQAAPTLIFAAGNILSNSTGYGIDQSSGTNSANVLRMNNLFYSNTSGKENGFGDWPSIAEQTGSSSPFTNAGASDLSLAATSNALNNGPPAPGTFENESYTSYLDIGAVNRQSSGAGAGSVVWQSRIRPLPGKPYRLARTTLSAISAVAQQIGGGSVVFTQGRRVFSRPAVVRRVSRPILGSNTQTTTTLPVTRTRQVRTTQTAPRTRTLTIAGQNTLTTTVLPVSRTKQVRTRQVQTRTRTQTIAGQNTTTIVPLVQQRVRTRKALVQRTRIIAIPTTTINQTVLLSTNRLVR